jgi:carbonic anhydrase
MASIHAADRLPAGHCLCQSRNPTGRRGLPRRGFLAVSAASALVVGAAAALAPGSARGQTTVGPDAALAQLMAGNARFVAGGLTSLNEDLAVLRQHTVAKQEPFAAVLSCADSRVPAELIFDQSIGHLFVTRVAGNICTPEIIASLEYGAAVLGTAAIVVLGHAGCGAVKATIAAKSVPGQISALYAPIRPAVERAGPDLDAVIKANAQIQADLLRTASPVIAGLVAGGKLKVVAGYYELASGRVSLLA